MLSGRGRGRGGASGGGRAVLRSAGPGVGGEGPDKRGARTVASQALASHTSRLTSHSHCASQYICTHLLPHTHHASHCAPYRARIVPHITHTSHTHHASYCASHCAHIALLSHTHRTRIATAFQSLGRTFQTIVNQFGMRGSSMLSTSRCLGQRSFLRRTS